MGLDRQGSKGHVIRIRGDLLYYISPFLSEVMYWKFTYDSTKSRSNFELCKIDMKGEGSNLKKIETISNMRS